MVQQLTIVRLVIYKDDRNLFMKGDCNEDKYWWELKACLQRIESYCKADPHLLSP